MPTHWKKLTNPNYIGSWDFEPGEEKILTIDHVSGEIIDGAEGKKDDCPVVYFKENVKPLVLNSTNGKMISKLVGSPNVEDWAGKRIALHTQKIKAFGEVTDAVRVKGKPVAQAKPAELPACADCGKQIKDQDGYKAAIIAKGAKDRYGVPLCMDCATKRKAKKDEPNQADDAAEQPENQEEFR